MGNCYTFNHEIPVKNNSTRAGEGQGLTLRLRVDQTEFLPSTTEAGIKLIIHQQNETIDALTQGIKISAGFETWVALAFVKIFKFKRNFRIYSKFSDGHKTFDESLWRLRGIVGRIDLSL